MVAEKMVDGEIQSRWTSIIYAAAKSLSVDFILVKNNINKLILKNSMNVAKLK